MPLCYSYRYGEPMNTHAESALKAVAATSHMTVQAAHDRERIASILKDDRSPVTVADIAVQVAITAILRAENAPHCDRIVGEEGGDSLEGPDGEHMRTEVMNLVTSSLTAANAEAAIPKNDAELMELLNAGGLDPQVENRTSFWCLDPIDGTKGFLRGSQFAIALAYVEKGNPTIGVLGCPHLCVGVTDDYGIADTTGSTYVGILNDGKNYAYSGPSSSQSLNDMTQISVAKPSEDQSVRVCLSYEKAHGDQDKTTQALNAAGVKTEPIRIDSQCKYAMVASGRADLYLRLAREGYQEKSWDHAAGAAVVRAAGGIAEDMTGKPLEFSGRMLETTGGICVRTPAVSRPVLS